PPAATDTYPLSLHDALPIYHRRQSASVGDAAGGHHRHPAGREIDDRRHNVDRSARRAVTASLATLCDENLGAGIQRLPRHVFVLDRKSTRLNSSHLVISYAV